MENIKFIGKGRVNKKFQRTKKDQEVNGDSYENILNKEGHKTIRSACRFCS